MILLIQHIDNIQVIINNSFEFVNTKIVNVDIKRFFECENFDKSDKKCIKSIVHVVEE